MTALALVAPEQVSSLVIVNDQCETVERWAEQCESIPELQDANNKLAAITEYLDRTSTEGRARVAAAMRRLELRIGALAPRSNGTSLASDVQGLSPNQRYQFRRMAEHPDVVEQVIAESTDDSPASRSKVQEAITSEARTKIINGTPDKSRAAVEARVTQAKQMAEQNYTSRQIAAAIGITPESMHEFRRRHGVEVPADAVVVRPGAIDMNRLVRVTVEDAAQLSTGADLIDYAALDGDLLDGWVGSLSESIRFLTTLRNNLKKELTRRAES